MSPPPGSFFPGSPFPASATAPPTTARTLWVAWIFVLVLLLAVHTAFIFSGITPLLSGAMPDSDTYMRLVRVEALLNGQSWWDSRVAGMNAPYGDVLNWTRPLDVLILAGGWVLHHGWGFVWHDALFWSGAALPVFLHLLLGLAVVWAFAPLMPARVGPLLFLMVTLQPVMLAYNMAGRPDHQTLLLICAAMMLGHLVREQVGTHPRLRAAIEAGLWAGLGLWVSVEFQFVVLVVTGVFALLWLETGEDRQLRSAEGLSLGLFAMTGLAMLAERGSEWAHVRELDKVSLSQFLATAVNCGVWGLLMGWGRARALAGRLISLGVCGALGVAGLLFFAPEILRGPAGDVDPRVLHDFLLTTREMKPLLPFSATSLLWVGTPLLALPLWLGLQPRLPHVWMPLAGLVAFFTFAALLHARFAQFAAPFGAVLLVESARLLDGRLLSRWRPLVLAGVVGGPLLLALLWVGLEPRSASRAQARDTRCRLRDVAPTLATLPPGIIMAALNDGPELLYRTPHQVVAGPYHRNRDGFRDSTDFFATGDARLLSRRGISYVLSCQGDTGAFAQRLSAGDAPRWLKPIALPAASGFRLYRFLPASHKEGE